MNNFNYSNFLVFVDELKNLTENGEILGHLSLLKHVAGLSHQKETITRISCNWLLENKEQIISKDEQLFSKTVDSVSRTNAKSFVNLAVISEIWGTLPQEDKNAIWTWLNYFLNQIC